MFDLQGHCSLDWTLADKSSLKSAKSSSTYKGRVAGTAPKHDEYVKAMASSCPGREKETGDERSPCERVAVR